MSQWHKIVKGIFIQMINAIEYIHSKNICHFDISMENVLVKWKAQPSARETNNIEKTIRLEYDPSNISVKICDFGLAKRMSAESMFKTERFVGKSRYCSPEIVKRGKPFDAKC